MDGGDDGLTFIRRIVAEAQRYLKPGGLLALEIGESLGPAVLELLSGSGYAQATIEKDWGRLDRYAQARKPGGL